MTFSKTFLRIVAVYLMFIGGGSMSVSAQALVGKDFWFTFPEGSGNQNHEYYVYVVSQYCIDSAYLELPFLNTRLYFSVEPGEFYKLTIPAFYNGQEVYHRNPNEVELKSAHLVSPKSISAYLLNYSQFTPDGETLIPLDQCGTDYVVTMRGNGEFSPIRNTVIATENNTSVEIDSWDQFGSPYQETITLNRGETYLWETRTNCETDYSPVGSIKCQASTGSRIKSSKKTVVFSSIDCAFIGACGNCDGLMSTYLPRNKWSNHYVNCQVIQRNTPLPFDNLNGCENQGVNGSGDYVEITGEIGTQVTVSSISGVNTYTIPAPVYGNTGFGYIFIEIPASPGDNGEANLEILANKPVQVVQYTKGRSIDNNPTADPEALYIFSPEKWESSYFFYPIYTPTAQNLEITVVVEDVGNPLPSSSILINGSNIGSTGWTSIPNTNYKFKRLSDPEFISSKIESSIGAKFGFFFFARNQRETAFFSGGYGPLLNVSLCEQCADIAIQTSGNFCVSSDVSFVPKIYSFTVPSDLSYTWDFGDGSPTTSLTSPTHAYSNPGRYKVKLTVRNGTCVLTTTSFVQINTIDVAIEPTDTLICPNTSVMLRSNPVLKPSDKVSVDYRNTTNYTISDYGIDEFWDGVNGQVAESPIVINDNYTNGWSLDSVCINIKHSKITDIQASLESPCGDVVILAKKSQTAGRANYRKTCFAPTATQSITTALAPYTGTFIPFDGTGSWTSLQNCNPKGNWKLRVGDDSILVGGKILDWSLHYSTTNSVNNFAWSPNYQINNTQIETPVVNPLVDTSYVLTANDFNLCVARDTAKIKIDREPIKFGSRDTILCTNSEAYNLFNSITSPNTGNGLWEELTPTGKLHGSYFSPDSVPQGDYLFRYRETVYCGFDSAIVAIRVNKLPDLGTNGFDTICNTYGSYNLFMALGGNPDSLGIFTEVFPRGGSLNQNIFEPLTAVEGRHTFFYKKPVIGCQIDSTMVELIISKQRDPGRSNDTIVCENVTPINLFTVLSGNPNSGGEWLDLDLTGKMTPSGYFTPLNLATGTYHFKYRFANTAPCQDTSATVTVHFRKAPFADISTTTPKLCIDSLATVKVDITGQGPFNLSLQAGSQVVNYSNVNGTLIINPPINQAITYKIISLTDDNQPKCGLIQSDSIAINIFEPIQTTLIKEDCKADKSEFKAVVFVEGGDPATYEADGIRFVGNTYTSPPIPNGSNYTIVFRDSTNCSVSKIIDKKYCECISEGAVLNLTLNQHCETESASAAQLFPPVKEPEDTSYWILHDKSGITVGNVLERRTDSTFAFNPNNPDYEYGQTYYISQIVGDAGDSLGLNRYDTCVAVSRGTPVRWNALPNGTISPDTMICAGSTVLLNMDFTGKPPFTVTLGINGVDTVLTNVGLHYVLPVTPQDSTTYTIKNIVDSNTPTCSFQPNSSARVRVNQLPTAAISGGATICEGGTSGIPFSLTGTGPWLVDYTLEGVSQPQLALFNPNFVLNVSAAGRYKLTGVQDNYCVGIVSPQPVELIVNQQPVANAGTDQTNCGSTVRLSAVPSFGEGTWSGPAIFSNVHDPRAFALVSSFTTYTFTWTERNFPCPDSSDEVTIRFIANPTADAGEDFSVCGRTATLDAHPTFGLGSWIYEGDRDVLFTNGLGNPQAEVTVEDPGTYAFIWRESVEDICVDRDTVYVTFIDSLKADISRFDCGNTAENFSLQIQISGGLAGSYRVNDLPVTSNMVITPIAPSGGGYDYTVSDASGCGTVNLSGTYTCPCISNAGTSTPGSLNICGDDQFSIAYDGNYTLDANDTLVFIIHDQPDNKLGDVFRANPKNLFVMPETVDYNQPYYVSAVVGNRNSSGIGFDVNDRCLSITQGITVTFKKPSSVYLPREVIFCEGDDYAIEISTDGVKNGNTGSYHISYDDPVNARTFDYSTSLTRIPINPNIGNSYVNISSFVDDGNPGCSVLNTQQVKIKVLPGPFSGLDFDDKLCAGEQVQFFATSGSAQANYHWDFGNGLTGSGAAVSTRYGSPGRYSIKLQAEQILSYQSIDGQLKQHTCKKEVELIDTIKVQAFPTADFIINGGFSSAFCAPSELTIENISFTPAADYGSSNWILNGSLINLSPTGFALNDLSRGSYTLQLNEYTSYGCLSSTNRVFNVSGPEAALSTPNDYVCSDKEAVFVLSGLKGYNRIEWELSDEVSPFATYTNLNTVSIISGRRNKVVAKATLYDENGCSLTLYDSVSVINMQTNFLMNDVAGDVEQCQYPAFPIVFSNTSAPTGGSWKWTLGNGTTSTAVVPNSLLYPPGHYEVTLTGTDPMGLCSSSQKRTITIYQNPTLTLQDAISCPGVDKVLLSAQGAPYFSFSVVQWGSGVYLDPQGKWLKIAPDAPAPNEVDIQVTGTDQHGCSTQDQLTLSVVNYHKHSNIYGFAKSINEGDTVDIQLDQDSARLYSWEPDYRILCNDCPDQRVYPTKSQQYSVTVSDIYNCFEPEVFIFIIDVNVLHTIDVPDAFTPNGDNINEEIWPDGRGIERIELFEVYNRYGQLVHRAKQGNELNRFQDIAWNGKVNGKMQNPDNYTYVVIAKFFNDPVPQVKRGNFALIR